jgi:hypothetical protein
MDPKLRTKWLEQHAQISEEISAKIKQRLAMNVDHQLSVLRKDSVVSLTLFANEWIEDLEAYLIERNGVYQGTKLN